MHLQRILLRFVILSAVFPFLAPRVSAQDWSVLEDHRGPNLQVNRPSPVLPPGTAQPRVLLAGDSWAQYMWDDGSHNLLFDRYGHADKMALSASLSSDPGPGYTGSEYAISGSEARQWADTADYPWIANMTAALNANPTVDVVVLSIGGNDFLAGKSDGGWYKDMDLDVPGSEAAFIDQLHANTQLIIDAAEGVRPEMQVLISTYDYPNFNTGFWCFLYACPKREDLSRDPNNDLITDAEINGMMVTLETTRIGWANGDSRLWIDNAVGLMHYFYGDGVTGAGLLPRPGTVPPDYSPFPGGNPARPSLRSNFRAAYDPIHLDQEGYRYKIAHQIEGAFLPIFRGNALETFFSEGGLRDGWTDGAATGTSGITVGDTGPARSFGIVSFDTSALPDNAQVTSARFYITRQSAVGVNPFAGGVGYPTVDVVSGAFGGPEVEAGDATAAADFTDAGFLAGSAQSNGYAVGVEIDPSALGAVNTQGVTQFRLSFPAAGGGTGADAVTFADGDAGAPSPGFPTLASYMGTQAPFLDVSYEIPTAVGDDPGETVAPRLLANSPNPFHASTSIRFMLAKEGRVRLEVFDLQGRRVAALRHETMAAGGHAVPWDGRDSRGLAVSSGVYFARLVTEEGVSTRRMVVVDR